MSDEALRSSSIEEEWILKYRAALQAIPVEQPHAVRFHVVWNRTYSQVASKVARVMDKCLNLWLGSRRELRPRPVVRQTAAGVSTNATPSLPVDDRGWRKAG
jgi:hypothetical protein